jgi:hypothetical protein
MMNLFFNSTITAAIAAFALNTAHAAPVLVNSITIAGGAKDLAAGDTANANRLGGFFSDMVFDTTTNKIYALPDRGPGGGLVPYETRVQTFALSVNPTSGAISNLNLEATTKLTQSGQAFNGLNPSLLFWLDIWPRKHPRPQLRPRGSGKSTEW